MYKSNIKTLEDACKYTGTDISTLTDENDTPDEAAYKELKVIIKALNKEANDGAEWIADWGDSNQIKYIPYFYNSGSGLSLHVFVYWHSTTIVPGRLCLISNPAAEYVGTQFIEIYRRYLN